MKTGVVDFTEPAGKAVESVSLVYNIRYKHPTDKRLFIDEHPVDCIAETGGVRFLDDTDSAHPDHTYFALAQEDTPVIWILWNNNPNIALEKFAFDSLPQLKHIIVGGKAYVKTAVSAGDIVPVHPVKSLKEAVNLAYRLARGKHMRVVLSPAGKLTYYFQSRKQLKRKYIEYILKCRK